MNTKAVLSSEWLSVIAGWKGMSPWLSFFMYQLTLSVKDTDVGTATFQLELAVRALSFSVLRETDCLLL